MPAPGLTLRSSPPPPSFPGAGGASLLHQPGVQAMAAGLVAANALAWLWAGLAFHAAPVLLGAAALAYTLGLRHGMDADHLAAIDNVTRKLMQDGQRPLAVGLWFSLGHSTVVILATAALALAAGVFQRQLAAWRLIGGLAGAAISALFLFAIAITNLFILRATYRAFRRARRGEAPGPDLFAQLSAGRGLRSRIFGPLFRFIAHSQRMYWLGLLFGLGFDTASEIALLALSAAEAAKGLPFWALLAFPALFTAGMALVDTADGMLMLGAYAWAFTRPIRKLYYNLTVTAISILVALAVGAIEVLGMWAAAHPRGGDWPWVRALNQHFAALGIMIVAIFIASWLLAVALYRWRGWDHLATAPEE